MTEAEPIEELAGYITVKRAMELLNVSSKERVMYQIRSGKIAVRRWADALMLVKSDVERIAAIPRDERKGGRPRK